MKKLLALTLGFLLTAVMTAPVNADQDETPVFPSQESQVQSDQGQTPAPEQQEAMDQGAPSDPAVAPNEENPVQNDQGLTQQPEQQGTVGQVTPNDPSMSMDARYKQRLENKKRAAEMRQKMMSEGQGQEQTPPQASQ
jgi:hypothetical protein